MDNRKGNFYKNTAVLSLGKFLPKLMSFVTLPILTACLSKADYGTYDLINTLISLLMPIATLQIQSAAFRYLIELRGDRGRTEEIITDIFAVTIPISVVVSIAIPFFMSGFSMYTRIIVSVLFFVDNIFNTSSQVTRGIGGNLDYSISSVMVSVINCIGVVIGVKVMDLGLDGVVTAILIANAAAVIFLWLRKKIYSYIDLSRFTWKKVKELIGYSWPMVPNNLSNWVLKLSDRMVITAVLGTEANAVYAVANKIPNLVSLAQGVFVAAWQENASLAVKDKDADKYFTKMFKEMFSLMIGATALLIGFTPILFAIFIRGDYGDAYDQMPLLTLGMFFYAMSAFQGGIYIAHKKTKSVGITTIVAAAVNLVIDLALVHFIGITAGSISTVVAYLVLYIFRSVDSKRFQPMSYSVRYQLVCFAIILVMLVLCFLQITVLNIINIVLGIVVCCVLNRAMVKSGWNKVRGFLRKKG